MLHLDGDQYNIMGHLGKNVLLGPVVWRYLYFTCQFSFRATSTHIYYRVRYCSILVLFIPLHLTAVGPTY